MWVIIYCMVWKYKKQPSSFLRLKPRSVSNSSMKPWSPGSSPWVPSLLLQYVPTAAWSSVCNHLWMKAGCRPPYLNPPRPADWHDIPWLLSIYRLNGPNEWKKKPTWEFSEFVESNHIEVLGPQRIKARPFFFSVVRSWQNSSFLTHYSPETFNTSFVITILECWTVRTHLNIHLHNSLLTTGISFFCKPWTCIHIIWQ